LVTLSWPERISNYEAAGWKKGTVIYTDEGREWVTGTWVVGNDYRRKIGLYGEFPPRFLDRLLSLYQDVYRERILHLFAGTVPADSWIRVDANATRNPEVVGAIPSILSIFNEESFDLVVADPPYRSSDAERYGFQMPNKPKTIHEVARLVPPGGFLCWLDEMTPIFSKADWEMIGLIFLWTGTNRRDRHLTIFKRPGGEDERRPLEEEW
jgi:hypothetical protein